MKKYLSILILFLSLNIFAREETNPFAASENNTTEAPTKDDVQDPQQTTMGEGGGNPGDPTPIDDYIPLLVITAAGIIFYATYKKKIIR